MVRPEPRPGRITPSAPVSGLEMKRASVTYERTFRRPIWALIVVLGVLVGACGGGAHGTRPRMVTSSSASSATTVGRPSHVTVHNPVPRPPFRVGSVTLSLTEPSSPATATAHTAGGAPVRALPTVVRYPATGHPNGHDNPGATPARASGPFPLLVFSQGYDMPPAAYSWLMNAWASAGYVVAAPTYPRTDPTSPGGPDESDIVNHPADLRFVIASLAEHEPSTLSGLIDKTKVAVVGQSDGGDVSLAVAEGSCCRDGLVKAAVILSGAELQAFGGSYYTAGSVPLLAVQGSADTINPPGCSVELYDQAPRPKYYLELIGAPHLPPYVDPGRDRTLVARAVLDFLRRYLRGHPSGLRALKRDGDVAPVASLITGATGPGSDTYCPGAPPP